MRTIKNLPIPQDGNDAKFPDGQIRNQTDTETGTPVVREIYGDVLTNIYKILRDAGITPNEQEDSETDGYQFLEALKVFSNDTNDKRQLLSVSSTNIIAGFNFDNVPENYVFIGIVSEPLTSTESYSLISGFGGSASYPVNLTSNISASNTVLVIVNSSGSTIISIESALENQEESLTTSFGTPLSFNDSSTLYYLSSGNLIDDFPKNYLVENKIQVLEGSLSIKVVDSIIFKNKLICLTFDSAILQYKAFSFSLSNLEAVEGEITMPNISGVDNQPYMYCDGEFVYFTNSQNNVNGDLNDYSISKFSFNDTSLQFTNVSFFNIDALFEKTTNSFISNENLYTFINGDLYRYPFTGGAREFLGNFNTINGVVFKFNGNTYYSNGNVARQWSY